MSLVIVSPATETVPHDAVTAAANQKLLREAGVFTVSIVGGPGCGKTALIDRSIEALAPGVRSGVISCIVGGVPEARATTHHAHVQLNISADTFPDAWIIGEALKRMDLQSIDLLIIENVGTLSGIPPQVGQDATVVVYSVAAGHDKPAKHECLTRAASAIVLNKTDLLPFVPFNRERFRKDVRAINPKARLFEVSSINGSGFREWLTWLNPRRSVNNKEGASHWFG